MAVNFYQTTQRYNPEDSHLRIHRRENLKSYFIYFVRFQVLTAPSMKLAVFWDVAPCNLVEIDRRFKGAASIIIAMIQSDRNNDGGKKHL
jgi:hypothetical protein